MRKLFIVALMFLVSSIPAFAQQPSPLPSNYKTVYEDQDFLVMRVHYGPHEFVPMHDHTAFPTVYVYLNDSGEIELRHEDEDPGVVKRPPTHAGAFRVAPGRPERHAVQNLSDLPSDFLRIELKRLKPEDIKGMVRGDAPPQPFVAGTKIEFHNSLLQIERTHCGVSEACPVPAIAERSLLIALTPISFFEPKTIKTPIAPGDVVLLPAGKSGHALTSPGAHYLRISLLY